MRKDAESVVASRASFTALQVSYGYGRGSGQQSVTGFPDRDSAGSLWTIKGVSMLRSLLSCRCTALPAVGSCPCKLCCPSHLLQCAQGTPIKSGQEIRLQHIVTRRWLHSHLFASPLSNNQEVRVWLGAGPN